MCVSRTLCCGVAIPQKNRHAKVFGRFDLLFLLFSSSPSPFPLHPSYNGSMETFEFESFAPVLLGFEEHEYSPTDTFSPSATPPELSSPNSLFETYDGVLSFPESTFVPDFTKSDFAPCELSIPLSELSVPECVAPELAAPAVFEGKALLQSKKGRPKKNASARYQPYAETAQPLSRVSLGNESILQMSSADLQNFAAQLNAQSALSASEVDTLRKLQRKIKNRESAKKSRDARKGIMQTIEVSYDVLKRENEELKLKNQQLEGTVTWLQNQLNEWQNNSTSKPNGKDLESMVLKPGSSTFNSTNAKKGTVFLVMLFAFGMFMNKPPSGPQMPIRSQQEIPQVQRSLLQFDRQEQFQPQPQQPDPFDRQFDQKLDQLFNLQYDQLFTQDLSKKQSGQDWTDQQHIDFIEQTGEIEFAQWHNSALLNDVHLQSESHQSSKDLPVVTIKL
jgi:hypothetical protein